jgi:hypothetical protein
MILGLSTSIFTTVHVIISLIGIFSGVVVVLGWLGGKASMAGPRSFSQPRCSPA